MKSSASAMLKNQNIPNEAIKAHLYPDLKYKSLQSVGQLCNSGFAVVFRHNKVEIVKNDDVKVMGLARIVGTRNENTDFLWVTDINENEKMTGYSKNEQIANSVYALKTVPDVIKYHH